MSQAHELGFLADAQDRTALLQQWVNDLRYDERCTVLTIISKLNDPLAILPVELVIEILSHLPICDAWRLQLVGKRWHSLLSSERVLRANLARWESHNPADSARNPSETIKQCIKSKGRNMQALRLGCPFSKTSFRCELPPRYHINQIVALKGSRIAYIASSNSISVQELVTGDYFSIQGDAREAIHSLALGSDVVAFTTHSGKLYAGDISRSDASLGSVGLPSAAVVAMHVDRDLVGLLLNKGRTIALHNVQNGSLRCFDIVLDSQPSRHFSLLVDVQGGFIDVFCYIQTKLKDGEIPPYRDDSSSNLYCFRNSEWKHARYSLAGQLLTSSSLALQHHHLPHRSVQSESLGLELNFCTPSPSGHEGIYNIGNAVMWSFCSIFDLPRVDGLDADYDLLGKHCPRMVTFVKKTAQMKLHSVEGLGDFCADVDCQESEIAGWKDVHFNTRSPRLTGGVLETRNLVDGRSHFRSQTKLDDGNFKDYFIVGVNDTFMVTIGISRLEPDVGVIVVHCFDESLECTGFYSTRIWGYGGFGRLSIEKSSNPEGHLEPLWEHRLDI